MKNILNAIRLKDWWNPILIPILSFYSIGLIYQDKIFDKEVIIAALQLLFLSVTTASFGFYLNELTDIQEDFKAGKNNIVATFSSLKKYLLLFIILILIFISSIPFWENKWIIYLFCAQMILLMLYSCPPIRLKHRPFAAVILDSLYSGTIFYFIALLWAEVQMEWYIILLTFVFGIAKGLRNIIFHLDKDVEMDKKAGQTTIAHISQSQKIFRAQIGLFIIESISLIILLLPISLITTIAISIGLILLFTKRNFYTFYTNNCLEQRKKWLSEINTIHEVWLPIAMIAGTLEVWGWQGLIAGYVVILILFPGTGRIIHEIYLFLLNTYYLGYKIFYFISDLYFIHTKPHFDIGKFWRRLRGKNAVE